MYKSKQSPAPAQNERPAGNHTADKSAMIDPFDVLLKIEYDRIRMNSALLAREQELVSRSQELAMATMMENHAIFNKLITEIEKKLGFK